MITAKVELTQPLKQQRQFVAHTGSGHDFLLDDAGSTGPKPIELVSAGLAGCTAFDVITILRQTYHQKVTAYEVRVEADQAERPPQVFTAVRIHHVIAGFEIDAAARRRPSDSPKKNTVRLEPWCRRRRACTRPTRSWKTRPSG
jgi:uncharacterized OsmC-like protein